MKRESRRPSQPAAPHYNTDTDKSVTADSSGSRQVNWWSVHEHVAPRLTRVGSWPLVGTPAWCALPDDDPAKTAALLDAAQHWALRVETCQQHRCEASRDVSAAADWSAIAREMLARNEFYTQRPWLKRVS